MNMGHACTGSVICLTFQGIFADAQGLQAVYVGPQRDQGSCRAVAMDLYAACMHLQRVQRLAGFLIRRVLCSSSFISFTSQAIPKKIQPLQFFHTRPWRW